MIEQRQERYLNLIEQLLCCPNGQEPEVLSSNSDLIDGGLVEMMMQVSTLLIHENRQAAAKFLMSVARQLAKDLNLYPQVPTSSEVPTSSVS